MYYAKINLSIMLDETFPREIGAVEDLNKTRRRMLKDVPTPANYQSKKSMRELRDCVKNSGEIIDPALFEECCNKLRNYSFAVEEGDMNKVISTLDNWKTASDEQVEECKRILSIACDISRDQIGKMKPLRYSRQLSDLLLEADTVRVAKVVEPTEMVIAIQKIHYLLEDGYIAFRVL
jgi:hypothetical protein